MMRLVLCVAAALVAAGPGLAQGTPALEAPIIAQNPCSGLPGLETLDFVRVDRVTLTAAGDAMTGQTSGAIGCRSGAGAFFSADLAADISVFIVVSLADCSVRSAELTFSNLRGSAAPLLEAFRAEAEASLLQDLRTNATAACTSLTNP